MTDHEYELESTLHIRDILKQPATQSRSLAAKLRTEDVNILPDEEKLLEMIGKMVGILYSICVEQHNMLSDMFANGDDRIESSKTLLHKLEDEIKKALEYLR